MLKLSILLVAVLATFVNANSITLELDVDLNGMDPNSVDPYIFENVVKDLFDKIVAQLKEKDPAMIPNIDVDVGEDSDPVRLKLNIEDLIVRGFSSVELTNIKISAIGFKLEFKVDLGVVQIVAPFYKLDGLLVIIPLYGSGTFNLRVVGAALKGNGKLNIAGPSIQDLGLEFMVNQTNLVVTGFLDNEPLSEIISLAVSECFPVFMQNYGKRLGELLAGIIQEIINGALKPKPEPEPEPQPQLPYRTHRLDFLH
ncbi:hypothetical protein ILUMI_02979 [Ignelater luminosus]|uniref:Uncharacterized protein n=1 Tax=Ignelater luminosus TaxID=2038154 RepID=A0A8K0GMN5_IGNLU|nr:hypothetical protein ILUMI_02979 [Ignelater luminosus]